MATLAVAIVVIVALFLGREVFIPLVLAVLLSFVLAPLVNLLRRIHVPRIPAVLVTVVLALGVLLGISGVIGLQLADAAGRLPQYQQTVETKIQRLQTGVLGHASALIHKATSLSNRIRRRPAKKPLAGQTRSFARGGRRNPRAIAWQVRVRRRGFPHNRVSRRGIKAWPDRRRDGLHDLAPALPNPASSRATAHWKTAGRPLAAGRSCAVGRHAERDWS